MSEKLGTSAKTAEGELHIRPTERPRTPEEFRADYAKGLACEDRAETRLIYPAAQKLSVVTHRFNTYAQTLCKAVHDTKAAKCQQLSYPDLILLHDLLPYIFIECKCHIVPTLWNEKYPQTSVKREQMQQYAQVQKNSKIPFLVMFFHPYENGVYLEYFFKLQEKIHHSANNGKYGITVVDYWNLKDLSFVCTYDEFMTGTEPATAWKINPWNCTEMSH